MSHKNADMAKLCNWTTASLPRDQSMTNYNDENQNSHKLRRGKEKLALIT
jgi:hypothetical protein